MIAYKTKTMNTEFKMTPEIRAAMTECKWKKISKNTKSRIGHAQLMRALEEGPMGKKIIRVDRGTGEQITQAIMSDGDMIRHENELRKFCLFLKKSNQEVINHLIQKRNGGILFSGHCEKVTKKYIQQIYEALFHEGKFGRIGGGPNDWKIGWMGSRWRDIKCWDQKLCGRSEEVIIRAAYYGPRTKAVINNKKNNPEDKTSHFIIFEEDHGWGDDILREKYLTEKEAERKCI